MDQAHNKSTKSANPKPTRFWWVRSVLGAFFFFAACVAVIAALGVAQRIGWLSSAGGGQQAAGGGNVTYTCPMHPQIKQDIPGRCPICGMELVPASSAQKQDPLAVHIDPAARRVANIQTVKAQFKTLKRPIRTIGAISFDESKLATIPAYVDGRIEKMFASYTGVKVAKDNHLVVLYSPDLFAAQAEYLQSQKALKEMGPGAGKFVLETQKQLARNARHKLLELGMTEKQVLMLEKTKKPESRLTIYSPIKGTVIEKKVAEGDYVKTGQAIYKIADLSTVWLMLELFPDDASYIRHAQKVEAAVQSLPGEKIFGRVAFVDPVVDPKTRTVTVRVEIPQEKRKRKLKPGDYANATITIPIGAKGKVYDADLAGKWISPMHPQVIEDKKGKCPYCKMDLVPASEYGYSNKELPKPKALVLPRNAILHAGKNNVVYVETEPGRFEIRPVVLGPVLEDSVVVLQGIEEGEMVAASGNFLIDSQMQLEGKPSLIDPTRAIEASGTGPMHLNHFKVEKIAGETGKNLEKIYDAYFAIHKKFAADNTIEAEQVKALTTPANAILEADKLPRKYRPYVETIEKHAEHLHHLPLKKARAEFEEISIAVLKLASRVRAKDAKQPFFHMYCPMVKSKRGNWLQADSKLLNPYYGSKMLRCGDTLHMLPPDGRPHAPKKMHKHKKK